ncbi:MFS transporter [Gordonia sp. DT30]|uniref:MFS transporter n=1 Tax=Gordonia sp. DT30 TaxID=3416546 RepID=UPI003CF491EB
MAETGSAAPAAATWADLFAPQHRSAVAVLATGVAVFAISTYLTAASLPSAIDDIGGADLYAWVMTTFLLAAVCASMLVTPTLSRLGARTAYLGAFFAFGVGSLIGAVAPTMPVLLVGRVVQGLGGGLLTGLAFAVVRIALPERLWVRAIGFTSAMWGVGNLIGPVLGGLFSQLHFWRGSFWLLVVVAAVVMVPTARALPHNRVAAVRNPPIPWWSLVAVALAAAALSVASLTTGTAATVTLICVGAASLFAFVGVDRRKGVGLLPRLTYVAGNPLKWIYLSVAVLAIGSTTETFIPLFGQRIGGLGPFAAGLLGAALSWGWSTSQILSTTFAEGSRSRVVRLAGPGVLGAGLAAYGALQSFDGAGGIAGWFVVLFVAGCGIGMAFPHIATAAMTITTDDAEAARASAGVNTVQMVANAVGSAVAGLLVSFGSSDIASARYLFFGFAVVALLGIAVAAASVGRRRPVPIVVEEAS